MEWILFITILSLLFRFTVAPIFPYLGCAAVLQLSIINQEKISPSRGSWVVYLGHSTGGVEEQLSALGTRVETGLMYNGPQCTHCWTVLTAHGVRTNTVGETIECMKKHTHKGGHDHLFMHTNKNTHRRPWMRMLSIGFALLRTSHKAVAIRWILNKCLLARTQHCMIEDLWMFWGWLLFSGREWGQEEHVQGQRYWSFTVSVSSLNIIGI